MGRDNYASWEIDPSEFSNEWEAIDKLKFFARYALLAPSGHNTQPWRLHFDVDTVLLKADYNRKLPYSGLQANEPLVSLGACLGVFEMAAKGFGYTIEIDYVLTGDIIAKVRLGKETAADSNLPKAITNRVSNRSLYRLDELPHDFIQKLLKTPYANVSIRLLTERPDISFIADQTAQATIRVMGDPSFRAELSKWVRNNLTKQYDGMPGFVQGIPTPPSLLAPLLIKNIDISKDQANKDAKRILSTPYLLLLSVKDDSKDALLNAGSLYAQLCIQAQQYGFATSGIGTAIIDPATKKAIVEKFKLDGQPIAIIRLGVATKPARHAPRWPLSRVSNAG